MGKTKTYRTSSGKTANVRAGSRAEAKYKAQGATQLAGTAGAKASAERSSYLKSLNTPGSANYRDPGDETLTPETPQLPEINKPGAIEGQDVAPDGTPLPQNTPQGGVQAGLNQVPYEQALANLRRDFRGDLPGAEASLKNAYQLQHGQTLAGGGGAPTSYGDFASQVDVPSLATTEQSLTPKSPLDLAIEENPLMGELIAQMQDYNKLENRRGTLVEEWSAMRDKLGLENLDLEAMNLKNIIEGTEDDIRAEVTKAGGFATDSQVMALTTARNKDNIKAYNRLMDTIDAKEKTLSTLIGLESQDRQMASQRFMNMFNMTAQVAQYQQQFIRDSRAQYQWLASQPGGFESIQAAYADPFQRKIIDKTFGGANGLATLQKYAAEDRAQKQADAALDRQYKIAQIAALNDKGGGGGGKPITSATALVLADSEAAMQMLGGLESTIADNKAIFGPMAGLLGGWNPYNERAQDVQSIINSTKQIVGKYLEGGVLRKEDEEKYAKILPKLTDTSKVAAIKLANVRGLVEAKISAQREGLAAAGFDTGVAPVGGDVIVGPDGLEYQIID